MPANTYNLNEFEYEANQGYMRFGFKKKKILK